MVCIASIFIDCRHKIPPRRSNIDLKDLYVLWKERKFSMNGWKTARDVNAKETGDSTCMYCHQKVFLDGVGILLAIGYPFKMATVNILYTFMTEQFLHTDMKGNEYRLGAASSR